MTKSKCTSQFHWLGLQDFKSLEAEQKKLVPAISGSQKVLVFGTEFYPVLTLGVRGKLSEDLFATEQVLKNQGLEIVKTDRGGQATIHSPGQLIIYPMLDLNVFRQGIQDFVGQLMKVTVLTLKDFGIPAFGTSADPGIYTAQGKVGFCGLRSDHGVVRHGLSINIKNDLSLFQGIRSCGHSQPRLDQVSRYSDVEPADFFKAWAGHFEQDFYLSESTSVDMNTDNFQRRS